MHQGSFSPLRKVPEKKAKKHKKLDLLLDLYFCLFGQKFPSCPVGGMKSPCQPFPSHPTSKTTH